MRPDFNIGAHNGLLEAKHLAAMGQAIWLYLWFIDRQPKDTNKVLNGRPINYDDVRKSFNETPKVTYLRWLNILKTGGYINLTRTPYGYIVEINKAKKWTTESSKMSTLKKRDVKNDNSRVIKNDTESHQKRSHRVIKNEYSNNKKQLETIETSNTNVLLGNAINDEISKLYYQAIKALGLPVRNHNHVKAKIKELGKVSDHERVIKYLEFVRDKFTTVEWEYKPNLNEALDIYTKRIQVENTLKAAAKEQQSNKVFRI